MDGKAYIEKFQTPLWRPEGDIDLTVSGISGAYDDMLAQLVVGTCIEGQDLVSHGFEPGFDLSDKAQEALQDVISSERSLRGFVPVAQQARRSNGQILVPDKPPSFRPAMDTSDTLSESELEQVSIIDGLRIHLQLVDYSQVTLSSVILQIQKLSRKHDPSNDRISKIIREVLSNNRRRLCNSVEDMRGIITLEKDCALHVPPGVDPVIEQRVSTFRHMRHVPSWLQQNNEWNSPLHRLCASITELETFIALSEWVVDRNLPYLPVVAPRTFEKGEIKQTTEKNPRANILLVCMVPGRSEIIPVQVKNSGRRKVREEYDKGVVIITPHDLGLQTAESCIVTYNKSNKTGQRVTTKYGSLLEKFLNLYVGRQKNQVPKKTRQDYNEGLQHAFLSFDALIEEQMRLFERQKALFKVATSVG